MISDDELYRIAIFLGCSSMVLIILYHFLDLNAKQDEKPAAAPRGASSHVSGKQGGPTR